jgi:hypothetical protein
VRNRLVVVVLGAVLFPAGDLQFVATLERALAQNGDGLLKTMMRLTIFPSLTLK